MNNEINALKTFFTSIEVHLSNIWLQSCVNWCKAETLGPNYTIEELQSKVYEQWLLLDLRDVKVPVLPPDLSSKQHYTLNGNFCLQMMQIVDISKPKLWQLQKIRKSNVLTGGTQQDSEIVGTGKRLLQMTLTDGVQEVEAMEYHPIPYFSLNLSPGTKIRIMGPVVIRRGRLMLEQRNVKILGGEVEELFVSHAAENVLARWFKLPENPNPAGIEEKMLIVEKEDKNEGYVTAVNICKPKPKPEAQFTTPRPTIDLTEEEEEMMSHEFDMLMEAEAKCKQDVQNKTPDLFKETDFDSAGFENINRSSTSTQIFRTQRQQNLSLSLDDDQDDIFNDIDIDAHLDEIDKPQLNQSELVRPNTIPIAKLLENKNNISKGVFKIKAKFKAVEEKLTFSDDIYKLVIRVEDSSGDLVASVHSDLVSVFAGSTPADIISLRNNILGKDEAAIEKMKKALMKVRDKLVELDNVMVVQLEKDKVPVITKVF